MTTIAISLNLPATPIDDWPFDRLLVTSILECQVVSAHELKA